MKLFGYFLGTILPSASLAAYCRGSPNPDAPSNVNPIRTAPPKFIREVTNGRLYEAELPYTEQK